MNNRRFSLRLSLLVIVLFSTVAFGSYPRSGGFLRIASVISESKLPENGGKIGSKIQEFAELTAASKTENPLSVSTAFYPSNEDRSRGIENLFGFAELVGISDDLGSNPITVSGSTGANGTFLTLKDAFDAINANAVQTGNAIVISINGNTTEVAPAVLNAGDWASITISPTGGAARTISGAIVAGSPMIDFNGADNVTINGLNTGGNSLTIANTTVSATSGTSTIRFIGGATNNTITNSNIQGSGSMSVATNGAVIFFSTDAVTANGNDNNTISNNNIGPAGANLATKGILCNGSTSTTAIGNSGLVINNNNIFDYFGPAVTSAGVAVNGGCNTFSITNNRFYQTGTRTWTTGAEHNAILMNSTTTTSGVQGMTITGNIIGYASNTQSGTYTMTGSTGIFRGIRFNGLTGGTVSNINNNTIASVSVTGVTSGGTGTGSPFSAMVVNNGLVTTNSNIFGSQSATGSLNFSTTTTSSTEVYGIYNFSVDDWTANSNNIGGISVTNLAASGTFIIYPLRGNTSTTKTMSASSNNIGGTVANSISLTATGTSSQVFGIRADAVLASLTSNTIRNLTTNIGTGTTTAASIIGIYPSSTTPNHTLSQNTIHTLTNTNATGASVVTGIQFTGSTANVVERNLIYNLLAPTTSTAAEINGIRVSGGTTTYRNNMIALGANQAIAIGAAATNSGTTGINGFNGALGTDTFVHNSVYIGGTATSGSGASYALNGTQTVNTRSFRNNIFFNARSNSGATGSHYAVKINGTAPNPSGLTINNNVYFANGTGAVFGFFNSLDVANLAAWKTAVGQDAGSFESNPQYLDPTNAVPDLHIHPTNPTVIEGNGADVGVTNDFDGQTRASLTPVDIGADAGNFNGIDLAAPSITYTAFLNTSSTANRVLSVTITDVTGVATGGLAPRIYFNKNMGSNFSTACSLASGTTQNGMWNCTIDNSLVGGVVATDVIRYFVVAQDTLGNLAANPSAGFSGTDVNNVTTPPTTPNQYTIVAAISGSLNVGPTESITSLTNTGGAFDVINNSEVTGNLTINITGDLTGELGTVALNEFASPFSLLIKPAGGARVISGSNSGALIRLNGADRVRFDGSTTGMVSGSVIGGNTAIRDLTIQNTNTGTSASVISIGSAGANGAQNNTVQNVNILGQDPTTTLLGISLGGATPGTVATGPNNNNRIENCSFKRSTFGVYSAGVSAASPNTGTVITMNETSDVTADRIRRAGILVFNETGVQILLNSLNGISTNESADGIGIGIGTQSIDTTTTTSGGVINAIVERNRINGVASLSTTGFSASGIAVAGGTGGDNTIRNNMISGVTAPSTSPDFPAGVFVAGATGSVTRLFHNSISMTGDRGVVASQMPGYGIAITGSNPTVELKNNIFYTTQISSGGGVNARSYAIGMVTTTFTNLNFNYNAYFSAGANAGFFRSGSLGSASGTDYANITAWKAATLQDNNSVETDPLFVTPESNLHLQSMSPALGAGTLLASVNNDFDNDLRDSIPDIGADELVAGRSGLIPGGTYRDANLGSGTLQANMNITGNLTLSGIVNGGANSLSVGCTSTVTGAGTSNYFIGTFQKDFCSAQAFTFPVGTAADNMLIGNPPEYSPFAANVTAVGVVPSSLAVSVTDDLLTGSSPNQSASRFWEVTETGDITADIFFVYRDQDINGTETAYQVLRRSAGVTSVFPGGTVNAATNTATAPGVTEFSQWAAGNLPMPGTLSFSSPTYSVNENVPGSTVTLTVNRTAGVDGSVSVNYATANGTATGGATCTTGVDFISASGTLNFANTETSKTFNVIVCDDAVFEGNEGFTATLSSAAGGASIGSPATATVTIVDNEVAMPGSLQFSSPTYSITEAGPTATISVTRTGGSDGSVSVNYATVAGGTATGGAICGGTVDYVDTSGTLTFGNGVSAPQTFAIPICDDVMVESSETVNLALSGVTGGATLGTPNTAVLTITDNDLGIGGTINVGTGETYTSLTNAGGIFEAINTMGVSSNVTINIVSDLTAETGTVALNEISGGFSVLIKPSGGARTISGSAGASPGAIIRINDADNVTIDGSLTGGTATGVGGDPMLRNLTIQNTSAAATSAAVIAVLQGTNGAQNFTIKNVNISGQDPTQTLIGLHIGGNTIGTTPTVSNNNARVENCSFQKSIYGVFSNGAAATPATGTVISRNNMASTGANRLRRVGIFFFNQNGIQVTENNIGGIETNESVDAIGIIAGNQNITTTTVASGGVSNALISRNRINSVVSNSTTGFSAAGISIGGGTLGQNVIANNMITGVSAPSTSPDLVAGIFVVGAAGSNNNIVYNSIAMTGDRMIASGSASQMPSFGIAYTADVSLELKNNIFYTTQVSTGGGANAKSYAIGTLATTFANLDSNYNDFWSTGANDGGFRVGSLASGAGTDLANLAAWQAATMKDSNSQEADPLFVNPVNDLHLQILSPVLDDGVSVPGVTVDFDGEMRSATTPDIGADEISAAPMPGTLALSSATYSVGEAAGNAVITVNRTGGSDGAVNVNYGLTNGAATGGATCAAGIDFINTGGTLNFANGETSKTFNVSICNDAVFEGNETFNVSLSGATGGATIGMPSSAVVTIVDDESIPTVQFTSATYATTEPLAQLGANGATIGVTLSGPSQSAVTVNFATSNGTATGGTSCTPGVDYISNSGTLTFNGGETLKTFFVTTCADSVFEGDETVNLTLSSPVGATLGMPSSAMLTIIENDPPQRGAFSFSSAMYSNPESAGTLSIQVNRTGGTDGSVTVGFATSNGTATGGASCTTGVDYISTSGTLTFGNGVSSQSFNVVICNDTIDEPNETINYTLSNPTGGATIGMPGAAVQTIVDDDEPPVMYNVSIGDVRLVEGNAGTVNAVFGVTLSNVPNNNAGGTIATVQYATANGTATSGSDYAATTGTLNFSSAGTINVSVPVNGDMLKESNEFFFMNLSNPSMNVTITDGSGAAIIVDDDRPYAADFDRDLKADFSVFRPSESLWYVLRSTDSTVQTGTTGPSGNRAVPGDYDGDGKADFAVWQQSSGNWFVLQSSNNTLVFFNFGLNGDKPVQGDYDGDGKTDGAVFRPSNGTWYLRRSSDNMTSAAQFGLSTDVPVTGDFDGDFKNDLTVFRNGVWYTLLSGNNSVRISNWGTAGDIPVAGDFDGDGRGDLAVYRSGAWWIFYSLSGNFVSIPWGVSTDIPAPADFDGDGSTDLVVYRPSEGNWYILRSSNQTFAVVKWGVAGDIPAPAAYNAQP